MKVTIQGTEYTVRAAKAKDWFRLQKEKETDEDFQFAIMALCVVDGKGKPALSEEQIGELDMPDWQRLDRAVTRANKLDDDAGKN